MVPYRLIEKGGLTIGLLGVTATYPDFYDLLGWKVDNPIEAVANWTSELRSKADVLIVFIAYRYPYGPHDGRAGRWD